MNDEELWEISIRIPGHLRDRAIVHLHGISPDGFEEREVSEEESLFVFYRPVEEGTEQGFVTEFAGLISLLGVAQSSINMRKIASEDWVRRVRENLGPVQVGSLLIVPPWSDAPAGEGVTEVVISPGTAFGTGHHESSRLALREVATCMEELNPERILDIGCGTGLLAISALLLGAGEAYACDISPDAVAAAEQNAHRNGVQEQLHMCCVDAAGLPLADWPDSFPLVVANLTADAFEECAAALRPLTEIGGRLVLSGFYGSEARQADALFPIEFWTPVRRSAEGSWHALVLERIA